METRSTFGDTQEHVPNTGDSVGMDRFIDITLIKWHWKTQSQFVEWYKDMRVILAELKENSSPLRHCQEQADYAATHSFVREEEKHQNCALAQLKQEWLKTCDGGIWAMKFIAGSEQFQCKTTYFSKKRQVEQTLTIDLSWDWVAEYYGIEVAQYVKNVSVEENSGFMRVIGTHQASQKDETVTEIRFVDNQNKTRMSPRKPRKVSGSNDFANGYWEGRTNNGGVARKLRVEDLENKVIDMYRLNKGVAGDFVVLDSELKGPVIPIEDRTPIMSTPGKSVQKFAPTETKWEVIE